MLRNLHILTPIMSFYTCLITLLHSKSLTRMRLNGRLRLRPSLRLPTVLEVAYRAERVLLTKEMRVKREQEIIKKRGEAKEMQKQKFGVEGELFLKRQELIEPIQLSIFESLKDIAGGSGYMVVFDKSNQSNMLYTNPKYDISDRLIKKLGFVPGETIEVEKDEKSDGGAVGRGQDAINNARDNAKDAGRSTMDRARGGSDGSKTPKQ